MKNLFVLVPVVALISACSTNPTNQAAISAQIDYRQQASLMSQAISQAPEWMIKLPKESGVIYENGTAVSSDFAMADLKAKNMAYVKICKAAGGKLRSQLKTYMSDNGETVAEHTELTARTFCPDVDISGVETIESKHVAEGNRIRTYVLVSLPLGAKNAGMASASVQNRAAEAFKELDALTKEHKAGLAPQTPNQTQQLSTPSLPATIKQQEKSSDLGQGEPAKAEKVESSNIPTVVTQPSQMPAQPSSNVLNSVKAVGDDKVIVKSVDGSEKQVNLIGSNNPEYIARRAEALQKPGAVIGQTSVSN